MNFYISGEMTMLNEFIAAMNRNRYDGAKIKKIETQRVTIACRELPPIENYPVVLRLKWYRSSRRSDPDNVAFAVKFILDGMQEAGVLKQDTWASIKSISHEFEIDKVNPGVEIMVDSE